MKGQVNNTLTYNVSLFIDILGAAEEFYTNYVQPDLPETEGSRIYLALEDALIWSEGWLRYDTEGKEGE